jgi:hypothetical protein
LDNTKLNESMRTIMKNRASMAAVVVAFVLGGLAVEFLPRVAAQDSDVKKPKWRHGLSLMVRKADEANFGKDTKKIGIEVFKDENNGNLIYVSETGSISVIPGK